MNLFRGGPAFLHLLEHVEQGGYSMVVVDTLRRASGGADGNSSDMGVVVDRLDLIRRTMSSGTVLTIAHTDKSDTDTRGFSGIEDDSDIVWHAKRGEGLDLILSNTKMKDAPESPDIQLMMAPVLNSLVVEGTSPLAVYGTSPEGRQKVLSALYQYEKIGATASILAEDMGINKGTVYKALNRLVADGLAIKSGHSYLPTGKALVDGHE